MIFIDFRLPQAAQKWSQIDENHRNLNDFSLNSRYFANQRDVNPENFRKSWVSGRTRNRFFRFNRPWLIPKPSHQRLRRSCGRGTGLLRRRSGRRSSDTPLRSTIGTVCWSCCRTSFSTCTRSGCESQACDCGIRGAWVGSASFCSWG